MEDTPKSHTTKLRPLSKKHEITFEELKTILRLPPDEPESNWHRHQNPDLGIELAHEGGWVENTATVDETAYIGRHCIVRGKASVGCGAHLFGRVVIEGLCAVENHAVVSGNGIHLIGNFSISGGSTSIQTLYGGHVRPKTPQIAENIALFSRPLSGHGDRTR